VRAVEVPARRGVSPGPARESPSQRGGFARRALRKRLYEIPAGHRIEGRRVRPSFVSVCTGDRSGAPRRVATHEPDLSPGIKAVNVVGLDHVQLAAPPGCEDEARRFFGRLLGLSELEKPKALRARGGVWFALGEQQLHVGVEEPRAPARKAHLAFAVDG